MNVNLGFLNPHEAESLKMIDEFFDSSYKLSHQQIQTLKINKLSMLLRKNRTQEASKMLKDIGDSNELLSNEEYVRNRYFLLKKTK